MHVPIARIGGIGVAAALVAAGAVAVPPSAVAAEPFPTSGLYATMSGSVVSVDRATGRTATVLSPPNGATGLNQIGISADGGTLILTNGTNVYEYTAATESWQVTARGRTSVASTMGGVDPKTGRFFFGGQVTGQDETFTFASYDPSANAISSSIVTVTASDAPGGNGDVAFDGQGNLFFVASVAGSAQVYRVDADDLDGGSTTATKVGPLIDSGVPLNSMAFGDDGYLYIAGSNPDTGKSALLRVNPITGVVEDEKALDALITDLGSNALPTTASVTVGLPERFKDGDQFTVEIGGGGISTGNTATTSGDGESAVLGPILLLPGGTYTIEQTPEPGTHAEDYVTTWACIDPATGETIASGDGSSGEFTIPEGVNSVDCSFTNTVVPAPAADDDASGDNTPGSPVTVDVAGNDAGEVDPTTVRLVDGDGELVTELEVPGEGIWEVDTATGRITFTPQEGYTGNPAPVEYTVKDTRGIPTNAHIAVRYLPTAADNSAEDNAVGDPVTVDVLANDSANLDKTTVRLLGSDGEPVETLTVEGEGTWTADTATGAITFTPADGFIDSPTPVSYRADDGYGNPVTAKVTVTYLPKAQADESVDNAPLGSPVTVDVLANDSASIDPGSVRLVGGDGEPVTELVVDGEGTWTVDPATGAIIFTPEDGFTGNPAPVEYTADDGQGHTTVSSVEVAYKPAAADDASTGNTLGDAVTVDVAGNDSANLDASTVRLLDGDDPVTELTVDGEGTWTVDTATGAIAFAPAEGFTGDPAPVTYTVEDGRGNAVTATVTVTYIPAAADDVSGGNTIGDAVTVAVAGNDSSNVDPTTVRLTTAGGTVRELTVDGEGTWSVDGTGNVVFTPAEGFTGNPTPVTYAVATASGLTARATVTVTYTPVAADDASTGNTLGEAVTVDVLGNDSANVEPGTVRLTTDGGPVTELVVDGEGTWSVDRETGAITFTPQDGFTGDPTPVAYAAADARGGDVDAAVVVTYTPAATDDASRGNTLGDDVTVDLVGNDSANVDPRTVRLVDGSGEPVTELVVDGQGTWTVDGTGNVGFDPVDGFTGDPAPVTYTAATASGLTDTATVTVTYAPAAADDASDRNPLGERVTVDVVGNDSDNLDPATVRLVDGAGDPVTELVVDDEGTWTVDPDTGAITFAPAEGFTGNPAPVEYTAATASGLTATATVAVTYTTAAVDDVADPGALGEPVTVGVLGNDSANLDPATVRLVDGAGDPVAELVVEGEGTWTVDPATGKVTFTPEDGFTGDPTPVTYTADDGRGSRVTATVTVAYTPAAADDASTGNTLGEAVTVDVAGNDSANVDPATVRLVDDAGDPVTELVVEGEGTWAVDTATGAVTFTPTGGFTGNPTAVTYAVATASGLTATATVTVAYTPVAADDASTDNASGKPVTVDVLDNDSANLDPATVRLLDGAGEPVTELVVDGEGTWTVDPVTGAVTFTPADGFTGDPTPVAYTAADALGTTVSASVTVAYRPVAAPADPEPTPADPEPTPDHTDPAPAGPSEPAPADPSPSAPATPGGHLAQTGVMVGGIVGAAAVLLALGLAAVRVARRRTED
jgi:CshA-type fibril repeat protein